MSAGVCLVESNAHRRSKSAVQSGQVRNNRKAKAKQKREGGSHCLGWR
jgi:hypothetical protein